MPELLAGYLTPPPEARPVGLRLRRLSQGTECWRIDDTDPEAWTWEGFGEPRHRFDPISGAFRTRYSSRWLVGAFRERYESTGRVIPADHADHHLVRLVATRHLRVFDLRREKNLDVLGLDDQVSTGQHPAIWETCHRLADRTRVWWNDLDAVAYRSRTTPTKSSNVAFFSTTTGAFEIQSWRLADRTDVLIDLVLHHGFTVSWDVG